MPGARAAQNLQMPHPRDWQGGQMSRSSPEGLDAAGFDWCINNLESHTSPPWIFAPFLFGGVIFSYYFLQWATTLSRTTMGCCCTTMRCCCTTQAANTPHPTKPLVRMCASGTHFPNFADIGDTVVLFVDFGHQFKPKGHQSSHDVDKYEASLLIHFLLNKH